MKICKSSHTSNAIGALHKDLAKFQKPKGGQQPQLDWPSDSVDAAGPAGSGCGGSAGSGMRDASVGQGGAGVCGVKFAPTAAIVGPNLVHGSVTG